MCPSAGLYNLKICPGLQAHKKNGKRGIWVLVFPDMDNTGNLPKILNCVFTHEIYLKHNESNVLACIIWFLLCGM